MGEYYSGSTEAMIDYFEPETPCRMMETRPCVDLSIDESQHYRVESCKPGECTRFPARDRREQNLE